MVANKPDLSAQMRINTWQYSESVTEERNVFIDVTDILFWYSTVVEKRGRGGTWVAFSITHRNKSGMAGGFRWHWCAVSNVFLEPPRCCELMQGGLYSSVQGFSGSWWCLFGGKADHFQHGIGSATVTDRQDLFLLSLCMLLNNYILIIQKM